MKEFHEDFIRMMDGDFATTHVESVLTKYIVSGVFQTAWVPRELVRRADKSCILDVGLNWVASKLQQCIYMTV
jgi:hypothetical protein